MKKVMLLVLTVMLLSALLMASGPSLRIVKLTVINKSGNEVMIKLVGSDVGKQFYYLTIPAGSKDWPTVEVFTVLEDVYERTTWYGEGDVSQCVGLSSSGQLVMDRNTRLVFTPCNYVPKRIIEAGEWEPDVCIANPDSAACKAIPDYGNYCSATPLACKFVSDLVQVTNAGEPSMEKVVYIKYMYVGYGVTKTWNWEGAWGKLNCGQSWIAWDTGTTKVPNYCLWRYSY